MTKPDRPFDPRLYFEFRLYREFSSGIPDQWMSHGIDLVHWFMGDSFPRSVVAHGGVFAWPDGRENPDTFQALLEYPKGFLVSYSTSFGNDSPGLHPLHGQEGDPREPRGRGQPAVPAGRREGQPRGRRRHRPAARGDVRAAARRHRGPADGHRRHDDRAHGQLARVPALAAGRPTARSRTASRTRWPASMAAQSYWSGRKLYWDAAPRRSSITPRSPEAPPAPASFPNEPRWRTMTGCTSCRSR